MSSLDNYEIIPLKKICQRARECKDIKKRGFNLALLCKIILRTQVFH